MLYAQIKNGEFVQEFGQELVRWDADNYCSAEALVKDGKADLFGVVPLQPTEPPAFDPITQRIERAGAELLSGQWQYKWSVIELYATQSERQAAIDAHLAAICAEKWEAIKAERERRKAGGVLVGVNWFYSDEPTRTQYALLDSKATRAGWTDAVVIHPAWKTMAKDANGEPIKVAMTVGLLRQIIDAGITKEGQIFDKAEEHRLAMENSADPATYDFTQDADKTRWPVIFGE